MNKVKYTIFKIFSNVLHFIMYLIAITLLIILGFALYVKINTFDMSFLVNYLKKEQLIDKNANVKSLHLEFDKSFILVAKGISAKAKNISISSDSAKIELSKTSLIKGQVAAKRISVKNANISLNLDAMLENNPVSKKSNPNYHKTLKQASYLKLAKWTKSAHIKNSTVNIIYNSQQQELKNIDLNFYKTHKGLDFSADGIYSLNDNKSAITAAVHIYEDNDNIDLEIIAENLKTQDLINTYFKNNYFKFDGKALVVVNATINNKNNINNINASVDISNGFIQIPSLYNNTLEFKNISSNLNYDLSKKLFSFNKTKLTNYNDDTFNAFGDFNYSKEPTLNITASNKQLPLLDAFKLIPDLAFKKWLTKHIYKGTAKNVKFGFYGPLRKTMDGKEGNPYFDIQADFENVALTYLDGIPAVENGTGKFNMHKKNIDIAVNSAIQSKQNIKRASVHLAPLFETTSPLITIKALSNGGINDVLNVLNKKLNLKQDELFSHYSGKQETQSTIELNLDRLNDLDNYNPKKESFIKLNVRSDIAEVVGIDPIFKQRFKATDAVVELTEEDFMLEASGFADENPFSVVLKEKLLEFGQHTKLAINSNFDSYLLKDYLDIPSFNLSGLVYSDLILEKENNTWNFDLKADVENNLLNFGLLNYTKPYSKPGKVSAKGYFNLDDEILNLKSANLDIDNAKAIGSAKILLNNLPSSNIKLKDIVLNDKTKLDEFSLQNNILTIKGDSLDVRPFELTKKGSKTKKEETKQAINRYNIKLNKLYLDDTHSMADVSVLLNTSKNIAGLIKASQDEQSQDFYIRFTPTKDNPNLVKLESLIPNFGGYLRKADLYDNISNGHGILYGDLIYNDDGLKSADLNINVKKFQLLRAPLLAKALASISLEQLFSDKKGILFDNLYTQIKYEDSIIKISEGKIKGPSLGILFNGAVDNKTKTTDINGTLIPVVKLNSIVTNIPVLGYILTGSQGALSGADFKIYGTEGNKDISVLPLSVITPGIVKDLFDTVIGNDESKAIKKARKKAAKEEQKNEQITNN